MFRSAEVNEDVGPRPYRSHWIEQRVIKTDNEGTDNGEGRVARKNITCRRR